METILTADPAGTAALGARLARDAVAGEVWALVGELGAGKTHFVQGVAAGLSAPTVATSPTFTLVHEYTGGRLPLFHFDLYRLRSADEALGLGWDEYLDAGGLVVVEWADKFPALLPPGARWLRFEILEGDARRIVMEPVTSGQPLRAAVENAGRDRSPSESLFVWKERAGRTPAPIQSGHFGIRSESDPYLDDRQLALPARKAELPPAMYLLALDCSTSRGSVALGWRARDEPPSIALAWEFEAGRGQGGRMFTVLDEAMRAIRESGEALAEIVVGLGPGSYSGVRQTVAAASGLAVATGAALLGVPSVLALDPGAPAFHAVGDARRGTFYYTAVQDDACLSGPELLADAGALELRLAAHPDWPVRVLETPLPGGLLTGAEIRLPRADALLFVPPSARQLPPLEPIYLRPVNITLPRAVPLRTP